MSSTTTKRYPQEKMKSNISSLKSKVTRSEPKQIKILERFQPDIIKMDSVEEFREYLTEHEDEMNTLSTVLLNRKFSIDGYRITKLLNKETGKSEISLRKDYRVKQEKNESDVSISEVLETINIVAQKYDELIQILQEKGIL